MTPSLTPRSAASTITMPRQASEPAFHAFFAYWQSKAPAGFLPGRQHVDPLDMPRALLPYLALYDVVRAGDDLRFRCRLAGTGVVALLGVDNTGRFIDETMSLEAYRPLHQSYCELVRSRLPQYWRRNVPYANRDFAALRRLALPLAADGVTVDMVISYYVPVPRGPATEAETAL